jgi:hypothetical protein
MFSFRSSPEVAFSNDLDVANNKYCNDLGSPAGKVGHVADLPVASDVNPGELTFEEGTSRLGLWSLQVNLLLTNLDTRHRWWNGPPFGCI